MKLASAVDTLVEDTRKLDSIQQYETQKISELGGLTLIKIDRLTKCNLIKGYYVLNKKITDSLDLAFLAKYQASMLFQGSKKDSTCEYPLMSSVYIYFTKDDYLKYDGDYVVMCNVDSAHAAGDVLVQPFKLQSIKKQQTKTL